VPNFVQVVFGFFFALGFVLFAAASLRVPMRLPASQNIPIEQVIDGFLYSS